MLATSCGVSGNQVHASGDASSARPARVNAMTSPASATASVASAACGCPARAAAKSSAQRGSASPDGATGRSNAYSALPGMHSTSQINQLAFARIGSDAAS